MDNNRNEKLSRWEQEARCRLIRMGKDRGGIREWDHRFLEDNNEKLWAHYNDGSMVQLYTCGINGTQLAEGYSLVGGWARWLQDSYRAG